MQSSDAADIGLHKLKLVVFYESTPDNKSIREFDVDIKEFCFPDSVDVNSQFSLFPVNYVVGETLVAT